MPNGKTRKVTNEQIYVAVMSVKDEVEALRTSATKDASDVRKRVSALEQRVTVLEREIKAKKSDRPK